MGPCLCGDYMCPSCGPAQGYDPRFEALCETLGERVGAFFEGILDSKQQDKMLEIIIEKVSDLLAAQDHQAYIDARHWMEDEKAYQDYLLDQLR